MIMDGLSAPEVSEKLGVRSGLLYRWKREHLAELDTSMGAKAGSSPGVIARFA